MADEGDEYEFVTEQRDVTVARPRAISMIQVMPTDLDALEEAQSEATQAAGFAMGALGILTGAALGWVAGWGAFDAVRHAVFFSATTMSLASTLWCVLTWRRKAKRRSRVIERIRGASRPSAASTKTLPS